MDTPEQAAGASGAAEVHGAADTNATGTGTVALTAEQQAAIDAAILADQEDRAKAEAAAMEAKRLEDEADAAKEMKDRAAALAQANADAEAAKAPALRTDGPTLSEFVGEGGDAAEYPPEGFAVVTDEARIADLHPSHPHYRFVMLEKRMADLERKFKALHL